MSWPAGWSHANAEHMAQPTTRLRPIETVTPVWSAPTHVSLLVQPPALPAPGVLGANTTLPHLWTVPQSMSNL